MKKALIIFLLIFQGANYGQNKKEGGDDCRNVCGNYELVEVYYIGGDEGNNDARRQIEYSLSIEMRKDKYLNVQIIQNNIGLSVCHLTGIATLNKNKISIFQDENGNEVNGVSVVITPTYFQVDDKGQPGEWRSQCGIRLQGFYSPKFKR